MPPPVNKFRFYTNMLVSTLLSFALLLIVLHFAGYLNGVEGGIYLGFGTALLAWLALILAVIADIGVVILLVLRGHSVSIGELYLKHKIFLIVSLMIFIAIILVLQFATPYLGYIETGISHGIAPPILLSLAPSLSILAVAGITIYYWITGLSKSVLASSSPASKESEKKGQISIKIAEAERSPSEALTVSSKIVQTSTSVKEVAKEQLELISSILDSQDMQKLVSHEASIDSGQDRDQLQTRKNIEQWILDSVKGSSRLSKSRLEAEFERQFPKSYMALFNSVFYDLVYRDKLAIVREGNRTIIVIPSKP